MASDEDYNSAKRRYANLKRKDDAPRVHWSAYLVAVPFVVGFIGAVIRNSNELNKIEPLSERIDRIEKSNFNRDIELKSLDKTYDPFR